MMLIGGFNTHQTDGSGSSDHTNQTQNHHSEVL